MFRRLRTAGPSIVKAFCGTVVVLSCIVTFYTIGPTMETRYWPVVSKLQIVSLMPTTDGRTIVRAAFRKLRDCEYIGISWYAGDRPVEFERVSVVLQRDPQDTGSPNRPLGYQKAGPWIIGMPASDIRTKSFAQLNHRCHAFWVTTTEFYP